MVFTTKREAQDFANTVEVAKLRGEYVAPSIGRTTIGELGPVWLARQKGHMRPSGHRAYESGWRTHVEPRWGNVRLTDVRHTDVQAWVSELATHRGPTIVRHRVLGAGPHSGRRGEGPDASGQCGPRGRSCRRKPRRGTST